VFCQLETLRHCFPPNLRQFLNELPESLDETYEQLLKGINKAQKEDARRLLQCLTVAARPLRVEELAELLAFDFQATSNRGIPALREDWRWNNQEQAVLSTCSSLIAIVRDGSSRVVQFSHFSVKEYLTSPRLAESRGDVSRFYVDLNAAHTILAQACLGTLLRLDEHSGHRDSVGFPLATYAAQHWVEHAQFEDVSLRVQDGMDGLFDGSKPYFAAWLRVHDVDERWNRFSGSKEDCVGSPLYYAAFCGFHDLADRLIMEHPEQVNALGGYVLAPLPAALSKRHFHVADLLWKHGAVLDVLDIDGWTPLHAAGRSGSVDIMRWLLNHGANARAQSDMRRTPLHQAAFTVELGAVEVLLEHDTDINLQDAYDGSTPLHDVLFRVFTFPGNVVEIMRRLLEHGADPNLRRRTGSTLLHEASSRGSLEVVRLLLRYGANINEKDSEGRTPFQLASSCGHDEIIRLLQSWLRSTPNYSIPLRYSKKLSVMGKDRLTGRGLPLPSNLDLDSLVKKIYDRK
jgi:ankyrin repeat protein